MWCAIRSIPVSVLISVRHAIYSIYMHSSDRRRTRSHVGYTLTTETTELCIGSKQPIKNVDLYFHLEGCTPIIHDQSNALIRQKMCSKVFESQEYFWKGRRTGSRNFYWTGPENTHLQKLCLIAVRKWLTVCCAKTIPKFWSGKNTFQKCNPPDFKFYPSMLTDKNFPHMV